jgi:hypothetical protein
MGKELELVLTRLQEAGLKINAVKSFFAQTNLEYLGLNRYSLAISNLGRRISTDLVI